MTNVTKSDQRCSASAQDSAKRRVTVLGLLLDLVLGAIKVLGGVLFHSQALLMDGIHSFSDALSDLGVLAILRIAKHGPDARHPYGHKRFETLGTLLLGAALIAVAGALAWDQLTRLVLQDNAVQVPQWPVLLIAVVSIIAKEGMFRYTHVVGQQTGSRLLVANAWHSRSDALSSVLVLIAATGAMLGVTWLDALGALCIVAIVGKMGWDFVWDSVTELVDTGLSKSDIDTIERSALAEQGVHRVHDVRTRRMGNSVLLECHLQVAPTISVSEGHHIGVRVGQAVRAVMPDIDDVLFHIDPENDACHRPTTTNLPDREQVVAAVLDAWQPYLHAQDIADIRLHYLRDRVSVEVYLAGPLALDTQTLRDALEHLPWLGAMRMWLPPESGSGVSNRE